MERNIEKKPAQHIPTSLQISCILLRLSPICQIMYCCVVLDLPLMATNTLINLKVCRFYNLASRKPLLNSLNTSKTLQNRKVGRRFRDTNRWKPNHSEVYEKVSSQNYSSIPLPKSSHFPPLPQVGVKLWL